MQDDLLHGEWSKEILELAPAREEKGGEGAAEGETVYRGLRVRMGIHTGIFLLYLLTVAKSERICFVFRENAQTGSSSITIRMFF